MLAGRNASRRDGGFVLREIFSKIPLMDSIFSRIIRRDIPANIVFEDDLLIAFHDIAPQAPVHVLIVPKEHIATPDDLEGRHQALLGHMLLTARRLAGELGLADGYRLVMNCKDDGGQSVYHIHLHLLGGRAMRWPPG
jgi:histidine triad (HIT) family protein